MPITFLGEEKLRSSASLIACVGLLPNEIRPNFAFEGLEPVSAFLEKYSTLIANEV